MDDETAKEIIGLLLLGWAGILSWIAKSFNNRLTILEHEIADKIEAQALASRVADDRLLDKLEAVAKESRHAQDLANQRILDMIAKENQR